LPTEDKSISEKLGDAIKDEYKAEKVVQQNSLKDTK
jgi:hypothetical protein